MTSNRDKILYPNHLNPFGSDEEFDADDPNVVHKADKPVEYPDHLSPFDDEENNSDEFKAGDNYDESLNPFGEDEHPNRDISQNVSSQQVPDVEISSPTIEKDDCIGTPFEDDDNDPTNLTTESTQLPASAINPKKPPITITPDSQPESLDCPPVPLPRTKSLLKKELARKSKLENLDNHSTSSSGNNIQLTNFAEENDNRNSLSSLQDSLATFQKKKNKRNAPPVPINFKRQVSGSLTEIEEELNVMGDQLQAVEQDFVSCQDNLKGSFDIDKFNFDQAREQMIEILDRKNAILRRQKELMYRKRELKLDQIHSDIEYELRMIGNKQGKSYINLLVEYYS